MSANINQDRVMVVGEPAWHGIGTVLKEPATAVQAIKAAKLDYGIVKVPARYTFESHTREVPGKFVTMREDNGNSLGIVGERYQLVQNKDAFNFFDTVVGEGQAIYHTAGALGRGEKIWLQAKLPKDIIVKGDVVEKYLILVNTHDGTSPLQMFFSPVRVVCQNTLSASLNNMENEVRIRHSGDVMGKTDIARYNLKIAIQYYGEFETIIKGLADRQLTAKEVEKYFAMVVPIKKDAEGEEKARGKNQRDIMTTLFERIGKEQPRTNGTAWAAYNAVTAYVNHNKSYKNPEKDMTNRLNNIWFGSGRNMRELGFQSIVSLAGLN
jgi:phage/plasmid-like protein (TIGR03299 family)